MKKLKVMTVVGTRPEIIRLSRVLDALDASEAVEHIIVHTGQNYDYELNQIFFEDLGLRKPDYFLEAAGKTATETVGNILIKIDPLLEELKPDAFLVLGDTNSCLCAIPAKKRHIPAFLPFPQKDVRSRFSIWKQETDVSTSEFRKRPIVKL